MGPEGGSRICAVPCRFGMGWPIVTVPGRWMRTMRRPARGIFTFSCICLHAQRRRPELLKRCAQGTAS